MNVVALSAREKEIGELLEEIQPGKVALAEVITKKSQKFTSGSNN
jgi:hypothetical protein